MICGLQAIDTIPLFEENGVVPMLESLLKNLAKRAPALAVIVALVFGIMAVPAQAAGSVAAAPHVQVAAVAKVKKPTRSQLNREVPAAKEAVAKNCGGLYVPPGEWVDKGDKRYGRQYVCLRQLSDKGAEFTEITMILVPTQRVAGSQHKAVTKMWLDGYGTEAFTRNVTSQAFVVKVVVDADQSGKVWGVKWLKGKDAASKKQSVSANT